MLSLIGATALHLKRGGIELAHNPSFNCGIIRCFVHLSTTSSHQAMLSQNLLASFLGLLVTTKVVTAALDSGIFDKSAYGQAEWSRYCSSSVSKSADLLAHACFTIHDDITSAVHSSSEDHLGDASASGQGQ